MHIRRIFEVSEVYKEGESEPYKLNFKVVRAALTFQEEEYLRTHTNNVVSMAKLHLHLEDKHLKEILPHLTFNNVGLAEKKIITLCEYIE